MSKIRLEIVPSVFGNRRGPEDNRLPPAGTGENGLLIPLPQMGGKCVAQKPKANSRRMGKSPGLTRYRLPGL